MYVEHVNPIANKTSDRDKRKGGKESGRERGG